ncbi:hypothetical protein [Lactococcus kimchii]|uniref:hypothetical protein n=1 Tax=Lactococcus sp. S-13 TaxID=2507158 RepID=UPI001022A5FB|nr:hypothetical protein [Lactococcus sp. S-13]RZI49220.1 hypothetical protein EQJ87_07070 [Lactococcus sp. S-13]
MNNYFIRLMDALERLERNLFKINDLKREFEYQVNKLVNRQALFTALVLPIVILTVYTLNGSGMFSKNVLHESASVVGIRMFGAGFITWTIGVLLDFFFKYLFYRDYLPNGKTEHQKKLMPAYAQKREEIIKSVQPIIKQEIEPLNIPEEFIDVPTVSVLMNYVNEKRVDTLDEAVELFKKENTLAYQENRQSLLERFKEAEHENFLVGIEEN